MRGILAYVPIKDSQAFITKTYVFKYTENFTITKMKIFT